MSSADLPHDLQNDVDAIGRSAQVPVLLETILLATGMGFAAVARVTESRWVTCRALDLISFGLAAGDELEVESTLCHEVRQSAREIVIDDVATDPTYCDHHTPARYGFRSYISVPIFRDDGAFFGTLCAIDPEPRSLSDERVLRMFRLFAKLIGQGLDADEKLRDSEDSVQHERELADVQERFIAILAHDLRNPIGALGAGLRMLKRTGIGPKAEEIVVLMNGSVQRMAALIENLLTQARNRQGQGMIIERDAAEPLAPVLRQIVSEMNAVLIGRRIEANIDLSAPINCDRPRIAQLVSNLLVNAATHGGPDAAIRLNAYVSGGALTIAVANRGRPIPEAQLDHLFQAFERGGDASAREGLGLGLFIASEIAKGHGGTLAVASEGGWTEFTFTMPDAT